MILKLYDGEHISAFDMNGYPITTINGKRVRVSSIVWWKAFGQSPPDRIYHRNGNRYDLRPENLTGDRSQVITEKIRQVCSQIAARRCVKIDNKIVDRDTGAVVYRDYNKLLRLGLVAGYSPVTTTMAFTGTVTIEVPEEFANDVRNYVKRLHSARYEG